MGCSGTVAELIAHLRQDIAERRIASGTECLRAASSSLQALRPGEPGAAVLLGYLAQCVDMGLARTELIKDLLERFPRQTRASMPLLDYLHLRMAEAFIAMSEEEYEAAIAHLQFVGSVEDEIRDSGLLAVSNFWIGRCMRKQGRYDDALTYTVDARSRADEAGHPRMAATIRVLESWLVFQKGKFREAVDILRTAESAFATTDDHISLGNIQSAYGRIARRESRYERALEYFEKAIAEYKRHGAEHRNLARSLVNIAFVKRLIALRVQKRLDKEAARRKAAVDRAPGDSRLPQEKARMTALRRDAEADLREAQAIYTRQQNHRGMGRAHINCGYLCYDSGDLDRASTEAATAFRLGEEKRDHILMARARILQCMVEESRFEEEIDDGLDPGAHAQRAHEFGREAVELARQTQNRRLLARAQIWYGLTFANTFYSNPEAARECCDAAAGLLRPEPQDYIWLDLQELRTRILQKGRVETVLREWSQGLVGTKTFQQITEEFAGIIIPRVWEREGRKVSRVAASLCVSPKKVRRILHAQGLLGEKHRAAGTQS